MSIGSRFQRWPDPEAGEVRLMVDGAEVPARIGDSLAAALLAFTGEPSRHTAGQGAPRTAFCMMGICHECLVEVDGRPNVQACLTQVADGMVVRRQSGLPRLGGSDG